MSEAATCPECGAVGLLLCRGVQDYYFGSPGDWDYYRCQDNNCGVAWPYPLPSGAVLAEAYGHYYTHQAEDVPDTVGKLQLALTRMLYAVARQGRFSYSLSRLRRIPLVGRVLEDCLLESGCIAPKKTGMIVDIGCGSGDRLSLFAALGWGKAVGVEPDDAAVAAARQIGRDVRFGGADALPFEDATVDAAVMHHVIEHVPSSARALAEACRVLKPGGYLMMITPNIDSATRAKWGQFWRGFEAPRHLAIFTVNALRSAAVRAGFEIEDVRTSGRSAAWMDNVSAAAARNEAEAKASLLEVLMRSQSCFRTQERKIAAGDEIGDEIVLMARKPSANPGDVRSSGSF